MVTFTDNNDINVPDSSSVGHNKLPKRSSSTNRDKPSIDCIYCTVFLHVPDLEAGIESSSLLAQDGGEI